MKTIVSLALGLLLVPFTFLPVGKANSSGAPGDYMAQQSGCVRGTFASYHNEGKEGVPPAGYNGPTFNLRQDYPDTLPPQEDYPWLSIPFENGAPTNPEAYITALKDYAFEGNWEADWVVQNNHVRNWYHVPWQDFGDNGREFVHGLTHELDLKPGFLGPQQTGWTNTWAVAVFNERAGWAIGQMWCDPKDPQPDKLNPNKDEPNWFPEGSMVVKLLFNTISDEQAPYMKGSFSWQADTYVKTIPTDRTPKDDPERTRATDLLVADRPGRA